SLLARDPSAGQTFLQINATAGPRVHPYGPFHQVFWRNKFKQMVSGRLPSGIERKGAGLSLPSVRCAVEWARLGPPRLAAVCGTAPVFPPRPPDAISPAAPTEPGAALRWAERRTDREHSCRVATLGFWR